MVPMIRNILGGFLFSGDDIYKKCGVLSGGERTRLAVARMLLRPANTLLLDEPTNHLDLDSKDVLLEALEDFGGTLIFVSHDRYFVDRLATKIIEVGHGAIEVYPGTYEQFLWSRTARADGRDVRPEPPPKPVPPRAPKAATAAPSPPLPVPERGAAARQARKETAAEQARQRKVAAGRDRRIKDLEARIADKEQRIKDLEAQMATPGFYDDRAAAGEVAAQHQALMWEVGDLMHQWETLQTADAE